MLKSFFIKSFARSFLPIFLTLILVSSIMVLFQIAKVTAYVQLEIQELFKLYLLMSVKLLVFALPLSFFLAVGAACKRLCTDNESIAIFSLGASPALIARALFLLAAPLSALLCLISLVFIPMSFSLYDNFVDYKKTIAKINLKTSNYGQKFGDWIYFSTGIKDQVLSDVAVLNPQRKELLLADTGRVQTADGWLILRLKEVQYYSLAADAQAAPTATEQAQGSRVHGLTPPPTAKNRSRPERLTTPAAPTAPTAPTAAPTAPTAPTAAPSAPTTAALSQTALADEIILKTRLDIVSHKFSSWRDYWKNLDSRSSELVLYIGLSLLPLAGLFWAIAWGVFYERTQKSWLNLANFIFLGLYFVPISLFANGHIYTISAQFVVFFALAFAAFKIRLKSY